MTEINSNIVESASAEAVEVKASYVAPSLVRMGLMNEKTKFGTGIGADSSSSIS